MTLNRILFSLALIVAFNANLIGQKTLNSNSVRNAYPICHFEQLDIDIIAEQNQELLEFQSAYKVDALLISNRPAWYVFKPLNNDVITFEIIPNDQYNDVDFILYEANHLASSIEELKEVRFMSSGANAGVSKFQSLNCLGKTGLREGALDKIESQGCKNGDDNFLAPASIENNKYYYIMINNYSNSKGYSILFNDETIELEDLSEEHSIISDVAFANNTICGSLINDIDELDLKSLKIFPNPVNEALTIDMSELSGITKGEMITFSIINESGASVLKSTKEFNKGEFLIDVSSLIIGNYFLYFELKGELVRKQFHKM